MFLGASQTISAQAKVAHIDVQQLMTSMPEMVKYFGKGDEALGYQRTMLIFAALLIVFLFITYKTTVERVKPPTQVNGSFWTEMKDLFSNLPVILLPVFGISIFIISLAQTNWSATPPTRQSQSHTYDRSNRSRTRSR